MEPLRVYETGGSTITLRATNPKVINTKTMRPLTGEVKIYLEDYKDNETFQKTIALAKQELKKKIGTEVFGNIAPLEVYKDHIFQRVDSQIHDEDIDFATSRSDDNIY